MSAQACMGGWACRLRDRCPHHLAEDRSDPSERLCLPGQDGVSMVVPIHLHRPAGSWEREASQQNYAALASAWMQPLTEQLQEALGV